MSVRPGTIALGATATLVAVVATFPFFLDNYILHIIILIYMYIILAVSWNILMNAGQISLGHAAFFGSGAYSSALLFLRFNVSSLPSILLSGLPAAALAVVIGYACLRLRGFYLAIATLAFAEALRVAVIMLPQFTAGSEGLPVTSHLSVAVPGIGDIRLGEGKTPYYYTALILALGAILLQRRIARSKLGLAFGAIREDEDAAEVLGIDTTKYKILAFVLSAFLAGLSGGFYTHYILFIDPSTVFSIILSVEAQIMPIVGGLYTLGGPIIGAAFIVILAEYLRVTFGFAIHLLVYGLMLIFVILFMRRGIMGVAIDVWRRLRPPAGVQPPPPTSYPPEPQPTPVAPT